MVRRGTEGGGGGGRVRRPLRAMRAAVVWCEEASQVGWEEEGEIEVAEGALG